MTLSPIDVLIVVLYVLGTTLLGAHFARGQRGLQTYFVGDRNVGWPLVLVSIVATETSTVTFLSVPGLAYQEGGDLTFLQLSFGYVVGRVAIAVFLLPQYLRGGLLSAYELLRQRFSPAVQRAASALFLLTRAVADGLRLYLAALLLGQFTGWGVGGSILALGGVTLLYTYLGGMQAVIWTDLIQFVIYVTGALGAGLWLLGLLPDGLSTFLSVGAEAGKFRLLDFSTDPARPFTFWAGLVGGAFFSMASHGADQMMVQRYLCSRSLAQARLALVASGAVVVLQFLLFLLLGVGLFVLHQSGGLDVPPDTKPDAVFGLFIVGRLPVGVVGLLTASVLASSMATLASSLNSAAGASVSDFYRPLRPGRSEADYLRVSRLLTVGWGASRVGVALLATALPGMGSVIHPVLSVAALTTGMLLGLFVLGSLRRPVAPAAALTGLAVGLVGVLLAWAPNALPKETREALASSWEAGGWGAAAVWARGVAWPWYAPLGTLLTVAAALLADRLGRRHGPPTDGGPQPGLDAPR
jgi:SSS family transporter